MVRLSSFDPSRGAPKPGVGDDGEDRQRADRELEPVGVDLGHHQPVVDDADEQGADDGAEHRPDAAGQRRSADHRRRDRLQLEPVADRGQRRMQPEHLNDAAEAGHHRTEHEAEQLDPPRRHAHRARGLEIAAGGANPVAEIGSGHHRRGGERDGEKPDERRAEQSARSDELGESAGGEIVRQERRKAAGDHHRQRAHDEQHAQRRDEARDGEGQSDEAVDEARSRRRWPSPRRMATPNGTPAMIKSEVAIGVSAKVEPTERSNSPQIIRIVTPIETSPTSGKRPRMPRRLSGDRNAPPERDLERRRQAERAARRRPVPAFRDRCGTGSSRRRVPRPTLSGLRRPPETIAVRSLFGEGVSAGPAWPAPSAGRPGPA